MAMLLLRKLTPATCRLALPAAPFTSCLPKPRPLHALNSSAGALQVPGRLVVGALSAWQTLASHSLHVASQCPSTLCAAGHRASSTLQPTSMGISRARVEAAIRSAMTGQQRGWYLWKLTQLQEGQLAAMHLADGDDDETIVGYLQGALGEDTVSGGVAAAGLAGDGQHAVAQCPSAGAGATAVQHIKCNLADEAPRFELEPKNPGTGVQLYRVNNELFVDDEVVPRLQKWLQSVEHCRNFPRKLNGPPPLFVSGLFKTGKKFVLRRVLPALLAESPIFGVGKPDEARVIKLDLAALPVCQGYQHMLKYMLEDVVVQMRHLGITSQALTRAWRALATPGAERIITNHTFCSLFMDPGPPVPVMLLIDEVQNLFLPRLPGSRAIDGSAQHTAMMLFKTLVTSPSTKLLVAVTGGSMASFMQQVSKIPPHGISVLSHSFMADLPSRHERPVLQKVLEHYMSRMGTTRSNLPSEKERGELLAASDNAAFLMQALNDFLYRPEGESMRTSLAYFMKDTVMQEGMNEWGAVLRDFSDAQRRAFLGLALTNEGLNLDTLQSLGLQSMLRNLTVPIRPGSAQQVLTASYHRIALQVLIGADGSMRDRSNWLALLSGDIHIGWVDACLHLLTAANLVKAWRDAQELGRAVELLQEAAEKLEEQLGAADQWRTQGWFQQVLFHEANQGKGGKKVQSLEEVQGKSAAAAYKVMLEERKGTLSAADHLAHYLTLLRNVVAHMATAVAPGERTNASASGRPAGDEGSWGEGWCGSWGEDGGGDDVEPMKGSPSRAAVQVLDDLGKAGRAMSCAKILSASPVAQPFTQVTTRYQRILMSEPPAAAV